MGDGWQPVHTCVDLVEFAAIKCNIFDVDEKRTLDIASLLAVFKNPILEKRNCPSDANE
jgi:hypothetical protein